MLQRIDKSNFPDYVIAMPLHPAKLRERGFNQSLLLAATVARELKLKLLPNACRRVRNTPPQSALPWKERKKTCAMRLAATGIWPANESPWWMMC